MAKLYFRYGAMNSGKTTLLMQVAYNYEERGMKVLIIKPKIDTKGNDMLISRIGLNRKVDLSLNKDDNLYKLIEEKYSDVNCILIDEAQFLTREQANQSLKIVTLLNIPVICYGLRTDFLTNGFPGSTRLLEIAHTLEEMKTICSCGRKAIFNARFVNDKFISSGEQVVIDDSSSITYISMCDKCYSRMKN